MKLVTKALLPLVLLASLARGGHAQPTPAGGSAPPPAAGSAAPAAGAVELGAGGDFGGIHVGQAIEQVHAGIEFSE